MEEEEALVYAKLAREKGSVEAAWYEVHALQVFGFPGAAYERLRLLVRPT